jgi:hypothetical protein
MNRALGPVAGAGSPARSGRRVSTAVGRARASSVSQRRLAAGRRVLRRGRAPRQRRGPRAAGCRRASPRASGGTPPPAARGPAHRHGPPATGAARPPSPAVGWSGHRGSTLPGSVGSHPRTPDSLARRRPGAATVRSAARSRTGTRRSAGWPTSLSTGPTEAGCALGGSGRRPDGRPTLRTRADLCCGTTTHPRSGTSPLNLSRPGPRSPRSRRRRRRPRARRRPAGRPPEGGPPARSGS